jgi:hypothetical protein
MKLVDLWTVGDAGGARGSAGSERPGDSAAFSTELCRILLLLAVSAALIAAARSGAW